MSSEHQSDAVQDLRNKPAQSGDQLAEQTVDSSSESLGQGGLVSEQEEDSSRPLTIGQRVSQARLALSLQPEDIASRTKFSVRQIHALESDDFSQLPRGANLRGFIRSIARVLDLDHQPLIDELPQDKETPEQLQPQALGAQFPQSTSRPLAVGASSESTGFWPLAVIGVVIVGLGGLGYMHLNKASDNSQANASASQSKTGSSGVVTQELNPVALTPASSISASAASGAIATEQPGVRPQPAQQPMLAASAPAQNQPAQPAASQVQVLTQQATGPIRLVFAEDSWVEVTQAGGRTLLAQLNKGGTEQVLDGKPPFKLRIGRAGAVKLYHNGQLVDLNPHMKEDVARLTLQ